MSSCGGGPGGGVGLGKGPDHPKKRTLENLILRLSVQIQFLDIFLRPPTGDEPHVTFDSPRPGAPPPRESDDVVTARRFRAYLNWLLAQANGYLTQPTEPSDRRVDQLAQRVERMEQAMARWGA